MAKDGDMRMLGAADGFMHVLADLKFSIGLVNHNPIHPRHVRKLREREKVLRPLLDLQRRYQAKFDETRAAYQRTTE